MMQYIPRILEDSVVESVRNYEAIVLTGPRQAGKTSMVENVGRKLFPAMETIAFDTPSDLDDFRRDPRLFFANHPGVLFLDEVQHAPDVFPYLKKEIDRARGTFRAFLSGSQPLHVMRGVSESLAGRACVMDLWPFCSQEARGIRRQAEAHATVEFLERPETLDRLLGAGFPSSDRDDVIPGMLKGGYPKRVVHHAGSDWLESYRRTYLQRDVRGLAQIEDLGKFDRFTVLCAGLTGAVLNKAELARDLGVDAKTVDAWLAILENTYQSVRLPPFFRNLSKRVVKHPKHVFADIGLALHLQGIRDAPGLMRSPQFGHLFETFVIMEIRKLYGHANVPWNGFFWRTPDGRECDLVLEAGGRAIPIEIKHASTLRPEDLRGLRAFLEAHGEEAGCGIVLSMDPRVERLTDRIWKLPLGLLLNGVASASLAGASVV